MARHYVFEEIIRSYHTNMCMWLDRLENFYIKSMISAVSQIIIYNNRPLMKADITCIKRNSDQRNLLDAS